MNRLQVAWKNVTHEPSQLLLNLLLFGLGVGLSLYLILVNGQVVKSFTNNLAGIDMVLGAKGSDLQMVFSSMYHIDNPTGNIKMEDCKAFLSPKHPLVSESVPLSLGDSYKGYRIVGTDHAMLKLYGVSNARGRLFNDSGEVSVGANVATQLGIKVGDTFQSSHGLSDDVGLEHDHEMYVTSILAPSGTVVDNLLLTSPYTVWDTHDVHNHDDHSDHAGHDHHHHDHSHSDIDVNDRAHLIEHSDKELTNILIKFKNNKSPVVLNLPNTIKKNTNMQACSPSWVLNQFYDQMGLGFKMIGWIAVLISIVSGVSIFISLLTALRRRKYQLAILRADGAPRGYVFALIILEGLMIALLGFVLGVVLCYLGYYITSNYVANRYQYVWETFPTNRYLLWFLLASLGIGLLASIIPAIKAFRLNIHDVLAGKE